MSVRSVVPVRLTGVDQGATPDGYRWEGIYQVDAIRNTLEDTNLSVAFKGPAPFPIPIPIPRPGPKPPTPPAPLPMPLPIPKWLRKLLDTDVPWDANADHVLTATAALEAFNEAVGVAFLSEDLARARFQRGVIQRLLPWNNRKVKIGWEPPAEGQKKTRKREVGQSIWQRGG